MPPLRPAQVTVLVAKNEQAPWDFTCHGARQEEATLGIGGADYSLKGFERILRVERKTAEDYIGSISQGRERFENEMKHLRQFTFRRVLVECDSMGAILDGLGRRGQRTFRSRMTWQSARGTTIHWGRHYCPIEFPGNRDEARDYAWDFMFGVAEDWWETYQGLIVHGEALAREGVGHEQSDRESL